jgi:ABC-type multidrug transport system fused ATPase/permease subunit
VLRSLRPEVTTIMVTHRLGSARDCDLIYFLENGRIIESGSFESLTNSDSRFQRMLAASSD